MIAEEAGFKPTFGVGTYFTSKPAPFFFIRMLFSSRPAEAGACMLNTPLRADGLLFFLMLGVEGGKRGGWVV